jgi:hypothetical protein
MRSERIFGSLTSQGSLLTAHTYWRNDTMYRDAEDTAPPAIAPPAEEEYEVAEQHVHLPPLSVWPITLALGITLAGAGIVTTFPITVAGIIVALIAIVYWIQELRHEHQSSDSH